jgi:predicted AlkP superfamily phosphohydrolase/phosphomutase
MIGLDAVELTFLREYADSLPVLSRFLASSPPLQLNSTAASLAGSVWPTFYTGTLPGEHGIYHHLQWDQSTMGLRRVSDQWLWAEPFWYRMERQDKEVIALDVPMTFPSRLSRGVEVINWGSHDTLSAMRTHPSGLKRQILKRFGPHPMGCEIPVNKSAGELELIRANLVTGARRKGELSRWLAESRPWDFFLTVFGETHRGGHILWPGNDAPGEIQVPPTALLDVYRSVDSAVGHLLDSPSMRDAAIVLFALHGMGPNISQEHFIPKVVDRINAKFAGAATVEAGNAGAPTARLHGQRSVMRLLREKLPPRLQNAIARAVPVGVRDFVVSRSVTSGHDWGSTPGLALLADLHGYFRFNLRGRESAGSLDAGGERFRQYRAFVRECFLSLKVADTGRALVKDLIFADEAFPGQRQAHLPDLIITWEAAPPASAIESALLGRIDAERATGRTGNHRPHGFCSVQNARQTVVLPCGHIADLATWGHILTFNN